MNIDHSPLSIAMLSLSKWAPGAALVSCRVVSTESLLTLSCPLGIYSFQPLLPCSASLKQVCLLLGPASLMFLLQPFHWPCSGKPIWSQKLHEYFGTISKDLGKKAVENKIPLLTLAMADTYD